MKGEEKKGKKTLVIVYGKRFNDEEISIKKNMAVEWGRQRIISTFPNQDVRGLLS